MSRKTRPKTVEPVPIIDWKAKFESEQHDHELTVRELKLLEKRFEFEREARQWAERELTATRKALVHLTEHLVEPPRQVAMALSFDGESKKWRVE